MEDRYRLVYRGEVLDGQHRAVVKKRLGALLKVDGTRLDGLFTGEAVVIRRDADTATAARVQAAFKQAGARLRVLPIEATPPADSEPTRAAPSAANGFTLRPRTGELLDPSERRQIETVRVDVSHLTLAPLGPWAAPARNAVGAVPDTSHLTLAEVGALLSLAPAAPTDLEVTLDADWEVAAPGSDLGPRRSPPRPAVDVDRVHFEVAPVGSDLGQKPAAPAPPPPDTSGLKLV